MIEASLLVGDHVWIDTTNTQIAQCGVKAVCGQVLVDSSPQIAVVVSGLTYFVMKAYVYRTKEAAEAA